MVYVADDGSVVNSIPWSIRRIFGIFTGVIYMVIMLPRPPSRRLGRPNTGNNVDIPFFGGCSSCAR